MQTSNTQWLASITTFFQTRSPNIMQEWVSHHGRPDRGPSYLRTLPWRRAICTNGRPEQETMSVGKLQTNWSKGFSSWPLPTRGWLKFWDRLQKHILQNCNIYIYIQSKDCVSCTLTIVMHMKDLVVSLILYFPCRICLYHTFGM